MMEGERTTKKQERRPQIGASKKERKQEGVRTSLPKSLAFDRKLQKEGIEPSTYRGVGLQSEEALHEAPTMVH